MDYYNFETPITNDIVLTAVWNDIINPNEPTLENLKKALDLGIAEQTYPIGTEFAHTDAAGKSNPWVIKHYGEMPMAQGETITNTYGAVLGLKYVESLTRYWSSTASNTNYVQNVFGLIFNSLPESEKQFFAEVKSNVYGIHPIFFPTLDNITVGTATTWQYYNSMEHFYERSALFGTVSSNPNSTSYSANYFNLESTVASQFRYVSTVTAAGVRSTTVGNISTSVGTLLSSQYCVFMPKTSTGESE